VVVSSQTEIFEIGMIPQRSLSFASFGTPIDERDALCVAATDEESDAASAIPDIYHERTHDASAIGPVSFQRMTLVQLPLAFRPRLHENLSRWGGM
jgi:hypothetical protein